MLAFSALHNWQPFARFSSPAMSLTPGVLSLCIRDCQGLPSTPHLPPALPSSFKLADKHVPVTCWKYLLRQWAEGPTHCQRPPGFSWSCLLATHSAVCSCPLDLVLLLILGLGPGGWSREAAQPGSCGWRTRTDTLQKSDPCLDSI